MNRRTALTWIILTLTALMGTVALQASAQQRIKERLPTLDALKQAGKIGEDNRGFVEARESVTPEQETLIAAENADRTELYALVAQRSQQTVEEVGKQRAVRIAQIAASGVWLQDSRGRWYQKP